ncbi:hypothetical protein [Oscillatoria sp. FACHB-1406]|uniref:hypothetical protein n=1 Tax=Oscillatoria sp. FACHB-1406 TaxID=2692846 RepID=UPI001684D99E|nr:hypothetical protein [Oscillatoria sp. FACHB-1406]MBD2576901.1 hypothetical protein [Oscillatoria sp. FACHB-1406]
MKIKQVPQYRELFHLVLENRGEQIANYFAEEVISKFVYLRVEARELWNSSLSFLAKAEEITGFPFHLNEKNRLHALDGIIAAEVLGLSVPARASAIKAFCLYYLSVHIIDDFIEDTNKFASAFTYSKSKNYYPTETEINASMVGFIFHVHMAITRILEEEPGQFLPKQIVKLQTLVSCSLSSQIKCFLMEKDANLTTEDIFALKQTHVSAEATSLIADFLQVEDRLDREQSSYFKEVLRSLGSLTQFTDDLRDYEDDKAKGNSNLLVSMEKLDRKGAVEKLADCYLQEEEKMKKMLQLSGVSSNEELLLAVPWYPFFLKELI